MQYEGMLPDGREIVFRPVQPDDKALIAEGFEALSPESRYRRFFRTLDHLSEEQLRYLTEFDRHDHDAWLAYLPQAEGYGGAGVGRWIRLKDEPEVAEAAITVIDSLHGMGIGTTLLWLTARSAIEQGISAFRVIVQGENHPVLKLLGSFDIRPKAWESGVAQIDVPLPGKAEDLTVTPSTLILKAAAEGTVRGRAGGETRFGTRFSERP